MTKQPAFIRWLVGGVIAFMAIAAGVYTGFALSITTKGTGFDFAHLNRTYLDPGDGFPEYAFSDLTGISRYKTADLLQGDATIFLFMTTSCQPCQSLETYWSRKVVPLLRPDIRIICVFDDSEAHLVDIERINRVFGGRATCVTTDRAKSRAMDGIASDPTLIAVDAGGAVRLLVSGFSRLADAKVMNTLL